MPNTRVDEHTGIPTRPASSAGPLRAAVGAPRRLDWLDALRGWAVLGVVAVHSAEAAHTTGPLWNIAVTGQYGVQLFFLVSALTISLTYESHIRKFGTAARSQFAWFLKRFFRIAPLYYLAAIFYPLERYAIFVASHHHSGAATRVGDITANLLFVHTWVRSANNSVVPGGWSIGVEMFFYVLVPFLWMIKPVRRRTVVLAASAIACLLITLIASKTSTGSFWVRNRSYFFYWFPTQAPVIIMGLIFYLLRGPRLESLGRARHTILCLGGALISLSVGLYFGTAMNVQPILAPPFFTASFLMLILGLDLSKESIVVNRFAVQLGRISFSVYIIQFVVLDAIRVALQAAHLGDFGNLMFLPVLLAGLGITSILAVLSKRLIEDPGIDYGHKLSLAVASGEQVPAARLP